MSYQVVQADKKALDKIQEAYYSQLIAPPQGGLFRAKLDGCTITAYKSGKVLFQGKNADKEAGRWGQGTGQSQKPASNKKKPGVHNHAYLPPANVATLAFGGSDEVGTGDYFGPIVVAAAFINPEFEDKLKALGMRDSKEMTDDKIRANMKDILKVVPYSLLVLPNEKYNQLTDRGWSQGKIKAVMHNKALLNLKQKTAGMHVDGFLIDQFELPSTYFKHIGEEHTQLRQKVYFQTKAEGLHMAVACASNIARYRFLKAMDDLSDAAGFTLPKGAGAPVDQAAAKLIGAKGEDALQQFAKVHFANTGKAKRIAGR